MFIAENTGMFIAAHSLKYISSATAPLNEMFIAREALTEMHIATAALEEMLIATTPLKETSIATPHFTELFLATAALKEMSRYHSSFEFDDHCHNSALRSHTSRITDVIAPTTA